MPQRWRELRRGNPQAAQGGKGKVQRRGERIGSRGAGQRSDRDAERDERQRPGPQQAKARCPLPGVQPDVMGQHGSDRHGGDRGEGNRDTGYDARGQYPARSQRGDLEGPQPAALPVPGEPGGRSRQRTPHGPERRHCYHDLHLGGQLTLARPAAGEDAGEKQVKADRRGDCQDKVARVAEAPRELQPQEASHRPARLADLCPRAVTAADAASAACPATTALTSSTNRPSSPSSPGEYRRKS